MFPFVAALLLAQVPSLRPPTVFTHTPLTQGIHAAAGDEERGDVFTAWVQPDGKKVSTRTGIAVRCTSRAPERGPVTISEGEVQFWTPEKKRRRTRTVEGAVRACDVLADDTLLVVLADRLEQLGPAGERALGKATSNAAQVRLVSPGRYVELADGKVTLRGLDGEAPQVALEVGDEDAARSIDVARDGQRVAVGTALGRVLVWTLRAR